MLRSYVLDIMVNALNGMVKCRFCGRTMVRVSNGRGLVRFYCEPCDFGMEQVNVIDEEMTYAA